MSNRRFPCSASWILPAALWLGACSPACTPPSKAPSEKKGAKKADKPAPLAPDAIRTAPGVELGALNEAGKRRFFSIINAEPSACGKPHSLATSINKDPECRDSLEIARFIAVSVAKGSPEATIKGAASFLAGNLKPKTIDNKGRPMFGNKDAPVTVTVFADFECPHCSKEAPVVRKAVQSFNGKANLVYRHFPLPGHDRARAAAIASEAAFAQGKFWEYHDLVFANQNKLSDADLVGYAKQIGLDMAKFDADVKARKGEPAVQRDKAQGEKLELTGTPAVFVNGRYYTPTIYGGTVEGWIDDALRRASKTAKTN